MLVDLNNASFQKPVGFIVLEGVNGAGKSTVQRKISEFLNKANQAHILTREPGGTPFGQRMREILLGQHNEKINPRSEFFLFSADRAHHVSHLIRPALANKEVVICDRFFYSALAFQGYGRGLDVAELERISYFAVDSCTPDLVILLDLPPQEGLQRTSKRDPNSAEKDSFEKEDLGFHTRLRNGFLDMAKRLPESFLCVDATQDEAGVWAQIEPVLYIWLKAYKAQNA